MVNNHLNISAYHGTPPSDPARRAISGGPLYAPEQIMDLLAQGNDALHLWTRKAVSDVQRFEMELEDVADLVKTAITRGRYIGSEWCVSKPNGPWAACDSYQLRFKQWIAAAHRDMDFDYYIKFAIAATGRLLLIVSCHPPEDRG